MGQQIILRPAEQRRDQQRGEVEIIERLGGEAQRRNQILDRQRGSEPQCFGDRTNRGSEVVGAGVVNRTAEQRSVTLGDNGTGGGKSVTRS